MQHIHLVYRLFLWRCLRTSLDSLWHLDVFLMSDTRFPGSHMQYFHLFYHLFLWQCLGASLGTLWPLRILLMNDRQLPNCHTQHLHLSCHLSLGRCLGAAFDILWHLRHAKSCHQGTPNFTMNVTGVFGDDAMLRQITDSVHIKNTPPNPISPGTKPIDPGWHIKLSVGNSPMTWCIDNGAQVSVTPRDCLPSLVWQHSRTKQKTCRSWGNILGYRWFS